MATVGVHYIKATVLGAVSKGMDGHMLMQKARIPEKVLSTPNARVHVDQMNHLVRLVWRELNDEFMGFTELPSKFGTFALMTEWASRGKNLKDLLTQGIRFYNQITDELQMELNQQGEQVHFITRIRRPDLDWQHFLVEFWQVYWHRFASWYIGKPIKLLASHLNYEPIDPQEYAVLFHCPARTGHRENTLVFHRSYLDAPLVKSESERMHMLRRLPLDFLTIPGEDTSLSAQIQQLLQTQAGTELVLPTSREVSEKFHISEQTLRRKLSAEGTSYQQIKDEIRRDLAIELLAKRHRSINEIARTLGFSEPRAFTRAFKGWTGVAPRMYRTGDQSAGD